MPEAETMATEVFEEPGATLCEKYNWAAFFGTRLP